MDRSGLNIQAENLLQEAGFPPAVETGRNVDGILGVGPFLKNTLALGCGSKIYPSQPIGDLSTIQALEMFDKTLSRLRKSLNVPLRMVVADLHPDYPSTRLAEEIAAREGLPLLKVQHHFAHLLSLMAESRVYDRAIGVAFDGTGFGEDGQIWGSEIFTFDPSGFRREYHLEYAAMPGGDRAAQEPWRMALSYLHQYGLSDGGRIRDTRADELRALLASSLPLPKTCGMGRLFDAVSALTGICQVATYEGEAPVRLEGARTETNDYYPFSLLNGEVRIETLWRALLKDLEQGLPVGEISGRFHNTILEMVLKAARALRERERLSRVFLSGGVFLNKFLARQLPEQLRKEGFEVLTHTLLPTHDGGVSSGQVLYGAFHQETLNR